MTDIASLGIRVQTQGVKEADQQLDSFAKTSERVEQSVKSAATTINKGFKPDTAGIKAQREELAKLVGQIDPAVLALDRLDKQEQKLRAFRTKGLVDSGTFADLTAKINANREALSRFTAHATSAGLSAKQLSQATRQLPMQFTDIFTSLATGQRPMQVLLQQGGQLKDIFGGIGPALRAAGGYVAGLINPLTLAAAAVAALGFAWKAAIDEAQAFNLALIKTGHYSADSAADLEALAATLDDTTDATQRFASNVVTQIAATGRISSDQLGIVSTAVTNMAKATQAAGGDADEAIKSLTKSFTDLSKDPVEALLRLNETQHFLTQATLEQVRSLVEQGREAEAAKVAIRAFADETNRGAKEIEQSINSASAVWSGFKNVIGESTDEVINFFRNADAGLQSFILRHEAAARALVKIQSMVTPVLPFGQLQQSAGQSLLDSAKASQFSGVKGSVRGGGLEVVNSDAERQRIRDIADAQREWNSSVQQGETQAQRLKRELDEAATAGKKLGKTGAEIAAAQDAIRASFAAKGPKGGGGRARQREMPDFSGNAEQEIERQIQAEQRATEAFRDRVAVLEGPLADAERDHIRRVQDLQALAAQSPEARAGLDRALELEAKRHEEVAKSIEASLNPLGLLLEDMRFELDMIGKSNAERAVMVELRRQNKDAMSAEGQAALLTAKSFDDEAKAKQRSIDLMDEFRSGASNALADIVTGAKSAKEAFADFFDDLARRITQMIAEQWIEKAFGAMGTSNTGSAGGGWLSAIASLFAGGRATGGPVMPNRLYEVGEHNKPELLQMHGRSYLIPGNKGNVEPITRQSQPSVTNVTTFYVPDLSSRRNQQQVADRTQRLQSRATARN